MFRFENPQYLYLILLLGVFAALHVLFWMRQKRRLKEYGDKRLVKSMMIDYSALRPQVKFVLLEVSLLFFIIALARPQFGTKVETRERSGIEAIIALDVSNSMLAEDVRPNRLEKSKMLISSMVDEMNDDKVGLIVYAGQAFTQLPITSDYVSAKMFLSTISPKMIELQGTDIAAAITMGMRSFTQQEDVSRAIFVITDGEDNEGGAVEAARQAAKQGIHVYVLGVGSVNGAPIPIPGTSQYMIDNEGNTVMSRLNEQMCQEIAEAGDGAYIYVDNSSSAQSKLSKYVDRLAKSKMESQMYSEFDEQYQGFMLVAMLLLILEVVILERENHVIQRWNVFKRGTMALLAVMMVVGASAQNDRAFIRRGNRLMRDTVEGKVQAEKAQIQYHKAIEQNPSNGIARYNLGNSLIMQSKAEDAMKEYEMASKVEKDKKRLSSIWHNMGVVLQAAKQYDKAIECYKQSLRNDPANDETRYNYVLCQRQLKNQPQDQNQQNQDQQQQQQQQQQDQKQQQQQQQQEKKDDGQQQEEKPKPDEMSRENAEQLLKAAMQDEKNTQEKVQRQQQQHERRRLEKQW
jgi:Ca-activated chloride channel family protein